MLAVFVRLLELHFPPPLNLRLHAGGELRVLLADADTLAIGKRELLVHRVAARAGAQRKKRHSGEKQFGHISLPRPDHG